MLDYLYDGTFEGLLTCVYHHYYTDKANNISILQSYQPSLLCDYKEVATEEGKAMTVYRAIEEKISPFALKSAYRAFLSCDPEKGTKILQYIVLGFRLGGKVSSLHGNPVVKEVEKMVNKVGVEQERMLQFVRFSVMDSLSGHQIMYASIEPDNDVLELIGSHFSDRFMHDPFIIHDINRNKAIIANDGHWYISDAGELPLPEMGGLKTSAEEKSYQDLWRTYFDHIAIKERINPACQKNRMPVKYWKHLTEMCR